MILLGAENSFARNVAIKFLEFGYFHGEHMLPGNRIGHVFPQKYLQSARLSAGPRKLAQQQKGTPAGVRQATQSNAKSPKATDACGRRTGQCAEVEEQVQGRAGLYPPEDPDGTVRVDDRPCSATESITRVHMVYNMQRWSWLNARQATG